MPSTNELAAALAAEDFARLVEGAAYARSAHIADEGYSAILVDGSQYSPSWRAMHGGSRVWDMDPLAQEIYSDELDRLMSTYNAGDTYMAWEEGCIFLTRPATFTTQEGAIFGMEGATCPNGHESTLEHRTFPSGYFRCPTCNIVYDEPTFDPAQYVGTKGDE